MSLKGWAGEAGMPISTLRSRLFKQGLPIQEALTKPVPKRGHGPRRPPLGPIACCGEAKTIAEWSRITGVCPTTITTRLRKGMEPQMALADVRYRPVSRDLSEIREREEARRRRRREMRLRDRRVVLWAEGEGHTINTWARIIGVPAIDMYGMFYSGMDDADIIKACRERAEGLRGHAFSEGWELRGWEPREDARDALMPSPCSGFSA